MGRIIDAMRGHRVLVDLLADTLGQIATDHIGVAHFSPGSYQEIMTEHIDHDSNTFYNVVYDMNGEVVSVKAYLGVDQFYTEYYPLDHTLYEPPMEGMPDITALIGHNHPHPIADSAVYLYESPEALEAFCYADSQASTPYPATPPPGSSGHPSNLMDFSFSSFNGDEGV